MQCKSLLDPFHYSRLVRMPEVLVLRKSQASRRDQHFPRRVTHSCDDCQGSCDFFAPVLNWVASVDANLLLHTGAGASRALQDFGGHVALLNDSKDAVAS